MKKIISIIRGNIYWLYCKVFNNKVHIGRNLAIYTKVRIVGNGRVIIGDNCIFDKIKGDRCKYVTIDTHSQSAVIRIGDNVSLYATRISSKYAITIGDNVLIEDTGILDTDFHSIDKDRGDPLGESYERCQIIIGNNVSIGAGSLVTKGVTIGDNVVVIPGSVVSSSIKPDSIVGGNPARALKSQ